MHCLCNATSHKPLTHKLQEAAILLHLNVFLLPDSKQELEQQANDLRNPTEVSDECIQQLKKSKKQENKKVKDAKLATIDKASKTILAQQPCEKCESQSIEIQQLREALRKKEEQLEELTVHNSDLSSSLSAKRSLVADLEKQLQSKKPCHHSGTIYRSA